MKRLNQTGSHLIALVVLVLALAVVGFAGYKVWQVHSTTSGVSQAAAKVPATIANTADLNQTSQALDSSSTQLDSSLDDSSLNSDLTSML